MTTANGGFPAHRYTPQVTPRWPRGSEPASVDAIFSVGQASDDRCILTPKNKTADIINAVMLGSLPVDLHVHESADYFGEDSEAQPNIYPN